MNLVDQPTNLPTNKLTAAMVAGALVAVIRWAVAAFFGKRHDHTLDAVDNLLQNGKPENPGLVNMFVETVRDRDGGLASLIHPAIRAA